MKKYVQVMIMTHAMGNLEIFMIVAQWGHFCPLLTFADPVTWLCQWILVHPGESHYCFHLVYRQSWIDSVDQLGYLSLQCHLQKGVTLIKLSLPRSDSPQNQVAGIWWCCWMFRSIREDIRHASSKEALFSFVSLNSGGRNGDLVGQELISNRC